MSYHYTAIRMTKIQKTDNTNCREGWGTRGTLIHYWWECKMVRSLWKTVTASYKAKYRLTVQSAVMLLGIYSTDLKSYFHIATCMWMCIDTLFIISKKWKKPRCPSIGKWVHELWYIHATEYYSVIKRNELSSHEKAQMNLKYILLSERSQTEKGM